MNQEPLLSLPKTIWGATPAWLANPTALRFFEAEQEVMRTRFPQFQLAESTVERHQLCWTGYLRTNFGNLFLLEVVHLPSYPYSEPHVYVITPRISGSPHSYSTGRLSVHVQWTPYRSTAVASICSAANWLLLYENWRATGKGW